VSKLVKMEKISNIGLYGESIGFGSELKRSSFFIQLKLFHYYIVTFHTSHFYPYRSLWKLAFSPSPSRSRFEQNYISVISGTEEVS
jgi:hypothetical protein